MSDIPRSIESEQSVIGSIMLGFSFDIISSIVRAEDFYDDANRAIFLAASTVAAKSQTVDMLTVCDALEASHALAQSGGLAYIAELVRNTPTSANAVEYARIVKDKSLQREIKLVGMQIASMTGEKIDTADKVAKAQAMVLALDSGSVVPDVSAISDSMLDLITSIDEAGKTGQLQGLTTGYPSLDGILKPLKGGHVHIIAGRPACGKTTLGINIVERIAVAGDPALIFSLEMPKRELVKRVVASLGKIPVDNMDDGNMAGFWDAMTATAAMVKKMPLHICDKGGLTIGRIRSIARFQKKVNGIKVVLIDYIGLIRTAGAKGASRAVELGEVSRQLKEMAKELDVPVIVLAQLNRGIEQRADKTPTMSDLRDSGEIEQDADTITFLYRPRDDNTSGLTVVTVDKNRHGKVGKFTLTLRGAISRFDESPDGMTNTQPARISVF